MRSLMTLLNIHHCNSGIWVVYYGHFVMFCWWAYGIASVILAINRLLEFTSPRWTAFFFHGYRTWIWLSLVLLYPTLVEAFSFRRFYFFDPFEGKWHFNFYTDGAASFDCLHIYSNGAKIVIIIFCYGVLIFLLRRKLESSGIRNIDMQTSLTIQATIQATTCILGDIVPIIIAYYPIQNIPLNSFISNVMWMSQHSAYGFVYALMNRQVKKTIQTFLAKLKLKKPSLMVVGPMIFTVVSQYFSFECNQANQKLRVFKPIRRKKLKYLRSKWLTTLQLANLFYTDK
ncbi:hypothetical protein L596_008707 [Steinernema carpocapsae]|uniref:Serpentine receptor class gamma n=1 Tax=Steinernema carpocapsae TaxID=34508 RepID=A0A4U5PDG1_STECR|nr:hypothetical protein L596_008707 [Steinernema carpocapsae]